MSGCNCKNNKTPIEPVTENQHMELRIKELSRSIYEYVFCGFLPINTLLIQKWADELNRTIDDYYYKFIDEVVDESLTVDPDILRKLDSMDKSDSGEKMYAFTKKLCRVCKKPIEICDCI